MKFTFKQFQEKYPNEDACLDKIFQMRFSDLKFCPECAAETTFHRVKKRKCYECKWCGYQIFPMAGTVFEDTKTPLTLWFHAIYLMTASRNGVSAKELERQLGVTYKCAWRMGHQIRKLLGWDSQAPKPLSGNVQIDEAYFGGHRKGPGGRGALNKTIVMAMIEEKGRVIAKVIPTVTSNVVIPLIKEHVIPGTQITTDELKLYKGVVKIGMEHDIVQHRLKEFVNKRGRHTNTPEGFWSLIKRSILGTHVWVSGKYLPQYLYEYEFRYNNRHSVLPMFELAFESLRPLVEQPQNPPNGLDSENVLPF